MGDSGFARQGNPTSKIVAPTFVNFPRELHETKIIGPQGGGRGGGGRGHTRYFHTLCLHLKKRIEGDMFFFAGLLLFWTKNDACLGCFALCYVTCIQ